jgi:hypothetical protein
MTPDPRSAPRYVACVGASAFAWADSLAELVREVRKDVSPDVPEDAILWDLAAGHARALALVRPDGEVVPLTCQHVPAP